MRLSTLALFMLTTLALAACSGSAPANPPPTAVVLQPTTLPPPPPTASPTAPVPPTAIPTPTATPTSTAPARASAVTLFDPAKTTIRLERTIGGFRLPTDAKNAGDGSGRLFVVEKAGVVRVVRGELLAQPFLDITPLVGSSGSEQGLLGIAFHSQFKSNGQFYVNYTDRGGNTVIARYKVSSDPNRADPNSAAVLLSVKQPAANHNGGNLVFGPDGYLYIGLGDGGGAGDRYGNSQNPGSLLAKLLRIDVDSGTPYGIPKDNPFIAQAGYRPEIWAWGLRNPWRYSFDRVTGDLYIADVGQDTYEEVNFQPASSKGGENYGWNKLEGKHCYPPGASCSASAFVAPVAEYAHGRGDCSITGGYVYRGKAQAPLTGAYLFADYCTGRFWALSRAGSGAWAQTELIDSGVPISSFGEDEQGELYALGFSNGALYRIVAAAR